MRPRSSFLTTVVVICHDYARYLPAAVASVKEQSRRPRLLVMDDASTDDTWEVATRLCAEDADGVTCFRTPVNRGLAWMRNRAAAMLATPWLVFLDADDWLDPRFVERGESYLERHPEVDVLTTDMTLLRQGRRRPLRLKSRAPACWTDLLSANSVGQTSLVRREMILALGGYDPGLHFEDWDFWIRASKAGYLIARLPGAHVFRREHGSNKSKLCDQDEARRQVLERHPRPEPDGGRPRLWWWPRRRGVTGAAGNER